jgi:quercetin 2,3-dioxygenase
VVPPTNGPTPSSSCTKGGSASPRCRARTLSIRTEGSTTSGTPALILDVELPEGGTFTTPVSPEFQGFAYVLEGQGAFGANLRKAGPPQLVLLGPGEEFTVTDAAPGTRFMLMAGQPYGETPVFNGPYVD